MYNYFCIVTDRVFIYANVPYSWPEFTAFDMTIDALAFTAIVAIGALYASQNIFWVGSIVSTNHRNAGRFFTYESPVWKPYFKKDGYFGIFMESTLWS